MVSFQKQSMIKQQNKIQLYLGKKTRTCGQHPKTLLSLGESRYYPQRRVASDNDVNLNMAAIRCFFLNKSRKLFISFKLYKDEN